MLLKLKEAEMLRKYIGLLSAIIAYYMIHEGAHLVYALAIGAFKQVNPMILGVQIDVFVENMTNTQLGLFCLVGSIATLATAYLLVFLTNKICTTSSKFLKASAYYTTMALLLVDPLYLSVLCGFFGGGDMNGISLLIPETVAVISYGTIFALNFVVFMEIVLPKYKLTFSKNC